MNIKIKLSRPYGYDSEPGDHLYGEPFDTEINNLIGGKDNWSSPPEEQSERPSAKTYNGQISIELHEDGPLIEFALQNLDQISAFISAIAAAISAWAAARSLRNKSIPDDKEFMRESGIKIQFGEYLFESKRNLTSEELIDITNSIARFAHKNVVNERVNK